MAKQRELRLRKGEVVFDEYDIKERMSVFHQGWEQREALGILANQELSVAKLKVVPRPCLGFLAVTDPEYVKKVSGVMLEPVYKKADLDIWFVTPAHVEFATCTQVWLEYDAGATIPILILAHLPVINVPNQNSLPWVLMKLQETHLNPAERAALVSQRDSLIENLKKQLIQRIDLMIQLHA
jgi:hypothetical protein